MPRTNVFSKPGRSGLERVEFRADSTILIDRLAADRKTLDKTEPELAGKQIPADMLTTSGSGFDSPAYAVLQVRHVAAARGIPEDRIAAVLAQHIAGRTFGILGEPRANVLQLNLDLQQTYSAAGRGH